MIGRVSLIAAGVAIIAAMLWMHFFHLELLIGLSIAMLVFIMVFFILISLHLPGDLSQEEEEALYEKELEQEFNKWLFETDNHDFVFKDSEGDPEAIARYAYKAGVESCYDY